LCPLYLEETDRKLKETALIFFRLLCLRLFTRFKKTAPPLKSTSKLASSGS
jgi:hypothetical protein